MRILIVNASPRRNGLVSRMLDAMREEAVRRKMDVDYVRVTTLRVRPCVACMKCRQTGDCALPRDDAQVMVEKFQACDAVIIGTPCYWGNIPGNLKTLLDRMVYGFFCEGKYGLPRPLHKGKRAIIVTTCTTPFPLSILWNQSRGAVKALRRMILNPRWSGFKVVKTIEKAGTRSHGTLSEKELSACRKAVRRL